MRAIRMMVFLGVFGVIGAACVPLTPPTATMMDVVQVTAGGATTCALLSDGTVNCWGDGFYGQLGDGMGMGIRSWIPVAVSGITTATAVTAGDVHTCALLSDGTVNCWGWNNDGQLGDGTNITSNVPVAVSGITSATAVTAGRSHTCAVLSDGTVNCWGPKELGRLGDGTNTASNVPVAVSGITSAAAVTAGDYHTCALLSDGTVNCWGNNYYGQLGDGTNTLSNVPVAVSGGITTATAVTAGDDHTCALLSNSRLKCWGANYHAQLGNHSFYKSNLPVTVVGLS